MNKHNPTVPSTKAKPIVRSFIQWGEDKLGHVMIESRKEVTFRPNGSIIVEKVPSKRDLHRMEVTQRCK